MLQAQSPAALGGAKSARSLKAKITQALHLIDTARTKRRPAPTLRRAKKLLQGFRTLAKRGMRRHRIDSAVADQLLELAGEAMSLLDSLRAQLQSGAAS
jgi:hypothetical protein